MADFEAGKHALISLAEWSVENRVRDRNEASTRFHLIDRLITDVLGWRQEDVRVEVREEAGVSDYELGRDGRQLLIEAKREGAAFTLPAGFEQAEAALNTLSELEPSVREAINQALLYCLERGIPLAVVSNGHQWIGFLASRTDGVAPRSGRAVVFSSLDDMRSRFADFWDMFSRPGVAARRLVARLQRPTVAPPPEKLSSRLLDYPGYKNRNPLAAELQILGGMFLEDIMRRPEVEPEFLRECYYSSGALSQYSLVSRHILEARHSLFFERETGTSVAVARDKKGVSQELLADVAAAALGQRPIILVGDVGVGKTIFVRHLIHVDAVNSLKDAFVLYVDFGNEPALAEDLKKYVLEEFARQLREVFGVDVFEDGFVRNVYQGEISRFRRGIASVLYETRPDVYQEKEVEFLENKINDLDAHLRASLEVLLKERKRQTVIFLDNIDQRPTQFQEEVFLISQALAATWPCTCFVALRPETFHRSKSEGSLTGYQPRVFTIPPPRVDRVIQQRIKFSRSQLQTTGRLPSFPAQFTLDSPRLDQYIEVLERAFLDNDALIELVENMSGGNVRRALDFVVSFVGSGHVDAQKILDILERSHRYVLPLHEFLRAVMFGEHVHYDPTDSPIGNLFDIASPDGREHFLLPILLSFGERAGKLKAETSEEGFVPIGNYFAVAQDLGFQPLQVEYAISRGRAKKMFDVFPRFTLEDWGVDREPPTHVRVTSVGAYSVFD